MATETHEAATSVCLNDHGGAVGMPQLCGEWMGNQVFWLVVTLVVIFFVLSKIALPRIASVLAERAGTITNDLAAAEDLKQKAVEAEEAYNKALADARVEAARIVAEAKAEHQAQGAEHRRRPPGPGAEAVLRAAGSASGPAPCASWRVPRRPSVSTRVCVPSLRSVSVGSARFRSRSTCVATASSSPTRPATAWLSSRASSRVAAGSASGAATTRSSTSSAPSSVRPSKPRAC